MMVDLKGSNENLRLSFDIMEEACKYVRVCVCVVCVCVCCVCVVCVCVCCVCVCVCVSPLACALLRCMEGHYLVCSEVLST